MQKKIKGIIIRAAALLLFAAIIASVILWQRGVYEISFIKRPTETDPIITTASGTADPGDLEPPETEQPPDSVEIAPPPPQETASEEEKQSQIEGIPTLGSGDGKGWKVSSAMFGTGSAIMSLKKSFYSKNQSVTALKIYQNQIIVNSRGHYEEKEVLVKTQVPVVRLYYGFVLLDEKNKTSLYSPTGTELVDNFKATLVYARSADGAPVVLQDGNYYELHSTRGIGDRIDVSEVEFKALPIDAPKYYASSGAHDYIPYSEMRDVYVQVKPSGNVGSDETDPSETDPSETDPSETDPSETDPSETDPSETDPSETDPSETDPSETQPSETQPSETQPSETQPSETQPSETQPSETQPSETQPEQETTASDSGEEPVGLEYSASSFLSLSREGPIPSGAVVGTVPSGSISTDRLPQGLPEGAVEIEGKYYIAKQELRWGFKDKNGNIKVEAKYKKVYSFSANGLAAVIDGFDRLIFVNSKGEEVISLLDNEYIRPGDAYGGVPYRQMYKAGVSGNISDIGMYNFDSGYVMVRRILTSNNGKSPVYENENILINENGERFNVPSGYELVGYSEGILLLRKNGKYGYMSLSGGWIQSPQFEEAAPFVQGVAVVKDESGKYGLINLYGEYLLPTSFDYISNASSGYIATFRSSVGWRLYAIATRG